MQFGFTEGFSPSGSSHQQSKGRIPGKQKHMYVAALDSLKALNEVHHAILLDKLVQSNIHDNLGECLRTYIVIFHQDGLSDSFPIYQGVEQGRILSTGFYKVYIEELLRVLKSKRPGLHIVTVYIGCLTCANDIALLALSPDELQLMLYEALNYSKKNRYLIYPTNPVWLTFPETNLMKILSGLLETTN